MGDPSFPGPRGTGRSRRVALLAPLLALAAACAAVAPVVPSPSPVPSIASAAPSASPSPTPEPTPTLPPIPEARLQAALDRLRDAASIPGVSVAITWDDGRRWIGVSGRANLAPAVPMTPGTGFALASISKTLLAAVVLELVGEGRLALGESVALRLPAYRLDPRITVRMLLDHTSGLPDFFANKTIDAAMTADVEATWTPARSFGFVGKQTLVPGKAWLYSNTNYLILAELVTAVTGHPLATEIRTRLLEPLGLATAWYQAVETPRAPLATAYNLVPVAGGDPKAVAIGTGDGVMPFRSVVTAAGGAGSIAATALDTARWMAAFAGGHVLTPPMQRLMLEDVANTEALHAAIVYGLGLQLVIIDGWRSYGHSGRYAGVRDVVRYLPDAGLSIAVLTNQGSADPQLIADELVDVAIGRMPAPTPIPSP